MVTAGTVRFGDGRCLSQWLPWHFDHCYNDQLNRAGVLRCRDTARRSTTQRSTRNYDHFAMASLSGLPGWHQPGAVYDAVMAWLNIWWQNNVVEGYKGPLMLSFVAFVVTFVTTRTITRLIRAGKGPFHNVSTGGVHMHHSTPGVLLLIFGGFTAVGAPPLSVWVYIAGLLVGIGASLVLDEFAMIFRLQDVYWTQEGQLSVNMVTLAAACIGLAAVGVSPAKMDEMPADIAAVRIGAVGVLLVHFALVAVTALKGKYPTALIGLFVAPVAWLAAGRLARPTSPWARWRYSPDKLAQAHRRAAEFDKRWAPVRRRWDDFIGGTPTPAEGQPAAKRPGS